MRISRSLARRGHCSAALQGEAISVSTSRIPRPLSNSSPALVSSGPSRPPEKHIHQALPLVLLAQPPHSIPYIWEAA
jgi:hypothetical protein